MPSATLSAKIPSASTLRSQNLAPGPSLRFGLPVTAAGLFAAFAAAGVRRPFTFSFSLGGVCHVCFLRVALGSLVWVLGFCAGSSGVGARRLAVIRRGAAGAWLLVGLALGVVALGVVAVVPRLSGAGLVVLALRLGARCGGGAGLVATFGSGLVSVARVVTCGG